MLVIFLVRPIIATPTKTLRGEQFATQIVLVNFIREKFFSVFKFGGVFGCDNFFPVNERYVRIVKRIDVDGEPVTVQRNFVSVGDLAKIKTRRIVVAHGKFVVGVVIVNEANFFHGIILRVKRFKNFYEPRGDFNVTNHFAEQSFAAQISVQKFQVT